MDIKKNKKEYETAEIEIIKYKNEDILGVSETKPGGNPNEGGVY